MFRTYEIGTIRGHIEACRVRGTHPETLSGSIDTSTTYTVPS